MHALALVALGSLLRIGTPGRHIAEQIDTVRQPPDKGGETPLHRDKVAELRVEPSTNGPETRKILSAKRNNGIKNGWRCSSLTPLNEGTMRRLTTKGYPQKLPYNSGIRAANS